MRLISRHVDYAVNALCFMAEHGSLSRASDLRDELDMPPFFIREILRRLRKAGILYSTRGRTGGFVLALTPAKISVYMLMEIFDDVSADDSCSFRKRQCPRIRKCRLRENLQDAETILRKRLQRVTIASLIED